VRLQGFSASDYRLDYSLGKGVGLLFAAAALSMVPCLRS